MSSDIDSIKAAINSIKEVANNTKEVVSQKTIQPVKKSFLELFLTQRIILLLISILVFAFLKNEVKRILILIEEYLDLIFGFLKLSNTELLVAVSMLNITLGILVYLSIYIIGVSPENRSKWLRFQFVILFFIPIILIAIIGFIQDENPDKTPGEIIGEVGSNAGNGISGIIENFICNSYGTMIGSKKCEKERNFEDGTTTINQEFQIKIVKQERSKISLNSPEEDFPIKIEFETLSPIKINKIECFVKGKKDPFFIIKTEDEIITQSITRNYYCGDIASLIEGKSQKFEVYVKVFYEVEESYSRKIAIINCKNQKIIDRNEEINCRDIDENYIERNIESGSKQEIKTLGGQSLKIFFEKNPIPLHLGDGIEDRFSVPIIITKDDNEGTVTKFEFTEIKIPEILKNKNNLINFEFNEESDFEETLELIEVENQNFDSIIKPLSYDTINFNVKVELVKKGNIFANEVEFEKIFEENNNITNNTN